MTTITVLRREDADDIASETGGTVGAVGVVFVVTIPDKPVSKAKASNDKPTTD